MNLFARIFNWHVTDHIELGTKGRSYWWRIVADNGNILATSETYRRKIDRNEVAQAFSSRTGIPIQPSK